MSGLSFVELDGEGLEGAGFARVIYFLNAGLESQRMTLPDQVGRDWVLHPVHRSPDAADSRAAEAQFDATTGAFVIAARTASVFVIER